MLYGGHLGGLEVRRGRGGGFRLPAHSPMASVPFCRMVAAMVAVRKRSNSRRAPFPSTSKTTPTSSAGRAPLRQASCIRSAGTLDLSDGDDALRFEATITEEMQETTWTRDFWRRSTRGLSSGCHPVSIPPSAVPDAETVEEEDPSEGDGNHPHDQCGALVRAQRGDPPGLSRCAGRGTKLATRQADPACRASQCEVERDGDSETLEEAISGGVAHKAATADALWQRIEAIVRTAGPPRGRVGPWRAGRFFAPADTRRSTLTEVWDGADGHGTATPLDPTLGGVAGAWGPYRVTGL